MLFNFDIFYYCYYFTLLLMVFEEEITDFSDILDWLLKKTLALLMPKFSLLTMFFANYYFFN